MPAGRTTDTLARVAHKVPARHPAAAPVNHAAERSRAAQSAVLAVLALTSRTAHKGGLTV